MHVLYMYTNWFLNWSNCVSKKYIHTYPIKGHLEITMGMGDLKIF